MWLVNFTFLQFIGYTYSLFYCFVPMACKFYFSAVCYTYSLIYTADAPIQISIPFIQEEILGFKLPQWGTHMVWVSQSISDAHYLNL